MLYHMINKNAQIVFNGVSDTGNISMQDILMQMKWNTHTHTKKKKKKKKNWQYILCILYLKHSQLGKNKIKTGFQQN